MQYLLVSDRPAELLRAKMEQEKDIAAARERKHFEDLCRVEQLLETSRGVEVSPPSHHVDSRDDRTPDWLFYQTG